MARVVILAVATVFTCFFAVLTLITIARHGLDVLTAISLLVLALFGFGILGALRGPSEP